MSRQAVGNSFFVIVTAIGLGDIKQFHNRFFCHFERREKSLTISDN
jgi:hypothetical protein